MARDDVTTSCHYVQYTKPTQPQKDIFTTRVRSAMSNTTSLFAPLQPAFFLLVASGGATFLWFACSGAGNKFHNGSRQLCWRMPAQRQIRNWRSRRKVGGWCWYSRGCRGVERWVLAWNRNSWAGILHGELCFNARGRAGDSKDCLRGLLNIPCPGSRHLSLGCVVELVSPLPLVPPGNMRVTSRHTCVSWGEFFLLPLRVYR